MEAGSFTRNAKGKKRVVQSARLGRRPTTKQAESRVPMEVSDAAVLSSKNRYPRMRGGPKVTPFAQVSLPFSPPVLCRGRAAFFTPVVHQIARWGRPAPRRQWRTVRQSGCSRLARAGPHGESPLNRPEGQMPALLVLRSGAA